MIEIYKSLPGLFIFIKGDVSLKKSPAICLRFIEGHI
jgi:hypothetical protein